MSLIQGSAGGLGGAGAPGGALAGGAVYSHTIGQSLRFDEGRSLYLSFTPNQTETDNKKFTFSVWLKRAAESADDQHIVQSVNTGSGTGQGHVGLFIDDSSKPASFDVYSQNGAGTAAGTRVVRDFSAWYHVVLVYDTTQALESDRIRVYVNGDEDPHTGYFPPENSVVSSMNVNGREQRLGRYVSSLSRYFNGYMAEVHMVDGQALDPTYFGETVGDVWVPKKYDDNGTTSHGANGYHLTFQGTGTATTTDGTTAQTNIGDDQSGNGNNWTVSANFASSDVMPDSPTNNWCTLNFNDSRTSQGWKEGNLNWLASSLTYTANSTMFIPEISDSDIYYAECRCNSIGYARGISPVTLSGANNNTSVTGMLMLYDNGRRWDGSAYLGSGNYEYATISAGDVFGIKAGNGELRFFQNGTDLGAAFTGLSGSYKFANFAAGATGTGQTWNFGQDSTFHGQETAGTTTDKNGFGLFKYSDASSCIALCAANIADPTIGPGQTNQADDFFGTALYSGSDFNDLHVGTGGANRPIDTVSIANSLTFVRADEHELSKDFGAVGGPGAGNRRKWTFSTWIKRTRLLASGNDNYIFGTRTGAADSTFMFLVFRLNDIVVTGQSTLWLRSDRTFKSTADWFHLVWVLDSDNSTNAEKMRLYIDGIELTSFSSDSRSSLSGDQPINAAVEHNIGRHPSSTGYGLDACLADTIFVDGQAYGPEQFGQVGSNGDWIPKTYSGTYGTTGFKLTYENSSYPGYDYQTSDRSGTTNDFDTAVIASHDVKIDTPTQNFNILNHETGGTAYDALTEGSLQVTGGSGADIGGVASNLFMPAGVGKWYFEVLIKNPNSGDNYPYVGLAAYERLASHTTYGTKVRELSMNIGKNATFSNNTTYVGAVDEITTGVVKLEDGDVLGVAVDMVNKKMWFSDNGTFFNSGDPANGTNQQLAWTNDIDLYPAFASYNNHGNDSIFNFGQDASFAGNKTAPATAKTDANGFGNFLYDVPSGYLAMVDDNYAQEIVTSPDWVWIKERTDTAQHYLFDTVRGAGKDIHADGSAAVEAESEETLKSFDSQGFTVGTDTNVNDREENYVAWTWKAGGPAPTQTYTVTVADDGGQNKYRFDGNSTFAPTLTLQQGGTYTFDQSDSTNATHPLRFSTTSDGTHGGGSEYTTGVTTSGTPGSSGAKTVITVPWGAPTLYYYCSSHSGMGGQVNTTKTRGSTNLKGSLQSVVSANTAAGFSIVSYTGTGANATIGHGLTSAPEMILIKPREAASNWLWYHKFDGGTDGRSFLNLNLTGGKFDNGPNSYFQDTPPTASVFYQNGSTYNVVNKTFIAYCFHNVAGYCKIGSYVGNSSTDGTFVHLGFRPAWVLIKSTSSGTNSCIFDSKRLGFNKDNNLMRIDNATEQTDDDVDFVSNGLKLRRSSTNFNNSSHTYVYIAFAEQPFKFANAR
jgi:hypothetical protein